MTPARDPKQLFFKDHWAADTPRRPERYTQRHQEAPRRHPGGTRRHPGGTQEARDILESECVISYAPAHKSDARDHFRVHGSDVTITV